MGIIRKKIKFKRVELEKPLIITKCLIRSVRKRLT